MLWEKIYTEIASKCQTAHEIGLREKRKERVSPPARQGMRSNNVVNS